jgi:hypothetical protein
MDIAESVISASISVSTEKLTVRQIAKKCRDITTIKNEKYPLLSDRETARPSNFVFFLFDIVAVLLRHSVPLALV